MDDKPQPQEAFTLPRQWLAEILLSSIDFGRIHRRQMDELSDLDLVEQFLEFLDAACQHRGATDLAAAQKAEGPCYVTFVGPR